MINLTKAIFLDRDGVINESIVRDGKPYAPLSLAELKIKCNPNLLIWIWDLHIESSTSVSGIKPHFPSQVFTYHFYYK